MCRIVGRVSKTNSDFKEGLSRMLESVIHGGPDGQGVFFDNAVALGHNRLSIIELSKQGHQPMTSVNGELVITFNGEIYNYRQLSEQLKKEGITFHTRTDTEVILKAYQQWGTDAFNRFQGIFSFALFDKKEDLFFVVRDHLGVKPLYYFIDDQELIFSSETKAFRALKKDWKENEDWYIFFLAFGSIPHPHTTLDGVLQLPAGSFLKLTLSDFKYTVVNFYRPTSSDSKINSNQEALAKVDVAVEEAVKRNLVADAQLGIFLSGGIDSSLLTLLADKFLGNVKTLSVNFDNATHDEYPFQQMVIRQTENVEHTYHHVTEHMFWETLGDVWKAMDQPSIDGVNTYFIAKFARTEGIKAALSGLGADEIFGGYKSFKRIKWMRFLRRLPGKTQIGRQLSKIKNPFGRLVYLDLPGALGDYLFLRGIYTPKEISGLLKVPEDRVWETLSKIKLEEPPKMNNQEYVSWLESNVYMSNQLLKDTDCMGMWHGVEIRVPFLDVDLIEQVRSVSPSIRYKKSMPKYLLTASQSHVLPHKIVFRRKRGFTFPFAIWMKHSAKRFRSLAREGVETDHIFQGFERGQIHWSKCWSLAVLNQFKKRNSSV